MYKKLCRSRKNRVLAGVCGGAGEYLNIDPVVVRILAIIFCFVCGMGVLAYIIAAIVIPDDKGDGTKVNNESSSDNK